MEYVTPSFKERYSLKTREMVWMNSAKACLKLAISQRQLTKRRTNGSVVFRLENGRYHDISKSGYRASWPIHGVHVSTVVADTSPTIPDRPILQELVTFDFEQHRIDDREVRRIRVGSMDVSFIFAHLNTMLLYVGNHRFDSQTLYILFTSSCLWYLK
jgi:hypothetical protein